MKWHRRLWCGFGRVISHNDRLAGLANPPLSPPPTPTSVYEKKKKKFTGALFVFKYDDRAARSAVHRWSRAARRSCRPAKCLSSPATQLRISMQERTFASGREGSEAVMKRDRFLSACGAYVFLCTFSQHGPGEQVVSHRGIWCAPR